ncbi:ABC transporter substrate-binding protein [Alkalibacterium sp. 20]|uniref:ABC transporter substrate-binding protein n=1 Tax=Alkalibacterium sp. 20 TaxID=1798803 RepID=UPI0008FFE3FD|nr:extracellular solute-binding protein [Alkalibacterium sp. 20]OJF92767.1 sugar ABC transporter substrate-binding protein [Alkalibacterium sp. 20]
MFKGKHFYKGLVLMSAAGVLAACGNDGDVPGTDGADDNGNGETEEEVSLAIMQGKVEFNNQFNELADMYMDENPNVSIEITSVGGGTDYFTQLTTRFSAGDEPDIFSVAGPNEFEQMAEYLADLSDTDAANAALEGTLTDVTGEDGVVTALPYNLEGYGFIYNKEVFEAAGIDAEAISTYEELEEAVQTIDGQKDDLDIEAVFAFPGAEAWVPGNHLSNVYLTHEFDENVNEAYNAETVAFEKGDEFQRMLDLQVDYSVGPVLSLDYSQQVEEYFSLGQVAMIQQGNWVYPTLLQMDPEFAENSVGMIPIPLEGYENQLPVGVPNYWAVNSNKDDATVQAAKDFLDWMYLSDEGKDFVINEFNFIPAYEGYDDMEISDPISQIVYDYSERGDTIGWVFNGYPTGWTNNEFGPNIQAYIGGEMTWDEMVENSISAWESLK